MFKPLVLLAVLTCLNNFKSAQGFLGLDDPDVTTYCTVPAIITIKSMKTGQYIDGNAPGGNLVALPEESAQYRFWKLLAGNGFYIIENLNTTNIFDVNGGCWDDMEKENVLSYKKSEVTSNNRFYINYLDHTIGVQCSGQLRVKVDDEGMVVVEKIANPQTSDDDIRFEMERVS